jgi:hypoxanthine phosphoribosyltransferase
MDQSMNKLHYDWQQIERWCNRIALDILKTDWRPDYVVGLTRGGLVPAVLLSHLLDVPMHTLKVQLRDGDTEMNCWMPEDAVEGKRILVVDDINDTGDTLAWIREDWEGSVFQGDIAGRWHKQIRVAVIINNLASSETVDWCAMDINKAEDPSWIVFPWEK